MPIEIIEAENRVRRDVNDKTAVLQRLSRIEGQVRGLRQMAESNRDTSEQIQQLNAVMAALREVALLSISHEIRRQVVEMAGSNAETDDVQRLVDMLRSSFRLA